MAMIDLKHLWKARITNLSPSQRRLLEAVSMEPTAHLYAKEYKEAHGLTGGGIECGLRKLRERALVGLEDGEWRVQPPEMRKWLEVLHDHGPTAAEKFRWMTAEPLTSFFGKSPLHGVELDLSRNTDLPRERETDVDSLFAQINIVYSEGPSLEDQALLKNAKRHHRRILEAEEAGDALADLPGTLSPEAGETGLAGSRIMCPAVQKVVPRDNYCLFIVFENGEKGFLDIKPHLNFGVFRRIKDVMAFQRVRVSLGALEWDCGVDLDPEYVYAHCKLQSEDGTDLAP
jgi:hypothetical protein